MVSLVVRLEKVHMAITLGLPSVRGRNHVIDRTKLLFNDIGPVKLGLQRIAWNGQEDNDFCRLVETSSDTLDGHTSVLLGNVPGSRAL